AAGQAKAGEMETALADAMARAEAAEASLAKLPSGAEQEIAANQLRRELDHQRVKAQGETAAFQTKQSELQAALAAMTERAQSAEASLAKAPASGDHDRVVNQLRMELEHQRKKAENDASVARVALEARLAEMTVAKAEAAKFVSEREAEMTQLRAEFEQKGK